MLFYLHKNKKSLVYISFTLSILLTQNQRWSSAKYFSLEKGSTEHKHCIKITFGMSGDEF
jgi:hypothetical protein